MTPKEAYIHARDIIGGRFPEGEPAIATDTEYAYRYARYIIDGRWPEGEPAIATDAIHAYRYAIYNQREIHRG